MTEPSDIQGFLSKPIDEALLERLITGYTIRIDPTGVAKPFVQLDCHDQSLRKSGRVMVEVGETLWLFQNGRTPLSQRCKGQGRFVQDLPQGPVKAALKGFPKLRALMQIGAGEIQTKSLAVLDELDKTLVRGKVWCLSSTTGQATIVQLQRLRGYERAYQKVNTAMSAMSGGGSGAEAFYAGLFPDMVTYRAKPEIELGKAEPSIQVAADIIQNYLKVARQNEKGVIADIDTEFLHDYRVSLRKVRSVISLFKGVFSDAQTVHLKQVFSDLMTSTGRMRDLDVYLLEKDKYFRFLPPILHDGLQEMFDLFETERARELSRLSRRLRSEEYNACLTNLTALFNGTDRLEPGSNAKRGAHEYACALIWKRYHKVCKVARGITDDTPDDTVHDLRIDCKKLRYLMEFFSPLFDAKNFKEIIKPLKKLQDNLGLFNDYSVQQESLLAFVAQHSNAQGRVDARIGLAVGGLIAVLDQRQKAERSRVLSSFEKFDGPETRHLFRTLFHRKEE
ncbi:CHAD domain-containing protein [uncultured Ruegeria sp.]|uniref:CHAD domain-containing protein n=1 Tax=uncultured Ruegeria sp. TaxID=259304 RepID=UPI002638AEA2|nr:CHAD domain-containing protein [uncultured Ruegeria sp.]